MRGLLLKKNLLLLFVFVCIAQLQAINIPPVEFIGLHGCFKSEKRHLSPWGGILAVDSDWLENFYKYGNSDVAIKTDERGRQEYVQRDPRMFRQDATNVLCRWLFHCIPNISGIAPSQHNSSPSKHLTIEKIAQLLELIDEAAQCKECIIELSPAVEEENLDPNMVEERANVAMKEVFDLTDDTLSVLLPDQGSKLHARISALCKKILPTKYFNVQSKDRFVQLILKSLVESGMLQVKEFAFRPFKKMHRIFTFKPNPESPVVKLIQAQCYPNFFLFDLFLSLLYFKVQSIEDYKPYLNVFGESVLNEGVKEAIVGKAVKLHDFLSERSAGIRDMCVKIIGYKKDDFLKKLNGICTGSLIEENFELIGAILLDFKLLRQMPMMFKYQPTVQISLDGRVASFPDCAETAFLNFMNIVLTKLGLYDANSRKFMLDDDERLTAAVRELMKLENKFKIANDKKVEDPSEISDDLISPLPEEEVKLRKQFILEKLETFFIKTIRSGDLELIHNSWSQMCTDKGDAGVEYLQDRHELTPLPGNFVKLTNLFLGTKLKNFGELSKLLSIYISGTNLANFKDDENIFDNLSWRNVGVNLSVPIFARFSRGHGEFYIHSKKVFLEQLFRELISETQINNERAHLVYMCNFEDLNLEQQIRDSKLGQNIKHLNVLIYESGLESITKIMARALTLFDMGQLHFFRGLHKTSSISSYFTLFSLMPNEVQEIVGNLRSLINEHNIGLMFREIFHFGDKPSLVSLFLDKWVRDINKKLPLIFDRAGVEITATALSEALSLGYVETTKMLLQRGASMGVGADSIGNLICAINSGDPEILKLALSYCTDIEDLKRSKNFFGIAVAFCGQHTNANWLWSKLLNILAILNEYGFDVNYKNNNSMDEENPLYRSVEFYLGYEIVSYLIKIGADVYSQPKDYPGLFEYAISKQSENALKAFVDNGIRDKDDNNMLHLAVKYSDRINLIKNVMAMNAELINERNNAGQTPGELARSCGKKEIANLLSPGSGWCNVL